MQTLEYTWSPGGDLLERKDTAPMQDQIETFQHDALHRLTQWGVSTAPQTAKYDVLGNIDFKSGAGEFSYDALRRLATSHNGMIEYEFLPNGNLETWGNKSLTWTPLDKIRSLTTASQSFDYRYDADGVRTFRTDGTLVHVQASELFERRYNGNWPVAHYRIPTGDGRIAAEVKYTPAICAGDACDWNSETRYVHDDHLGSSNVLSGTNGSAVGGVNYDPWGRPRKRTDWASYGVDSTTTNVISGFTGHQPEMEGGLINMRGRMYDPVIGRFASVDPIVSAPLSSQGWTPYSYVFNQPLSMVDPSGYIGLGQGDSGDGRGPCVDFADGPVCLPPASGGGGRRLSPATESQLYGSMFGSSGVSGHNGIGNGGGWTHNVGLGALYARNHHNTSGTSPSWEIGLETDHLLAAPSGGDGSCSQYGGGTRAKVCTAADAMITQDNPSGPETAEHVRQQITKGKTRRIGEVGGAIGPAIIAGGAVGMVGTGLAGLTTAAGRTALTIATNLYFRALAVGTGLQMRVQQCGSASPGCSPAPTGYGNLSRAAQYGIQRHGNLTKALKDTGLQSHHLIERRFAGLFGQTVDDMLAVAVTRAEHQTFTNAWRALIPYGEGTVTATRQSVESAARIIYADHPQILKALGL